MTVRVERPSPDQFRDAAPVIIPADDVEVTGGVLYVSDCDRTAAVFADGQWTYALVEDGLAAVSDDDLREEAARRGMTVVDAERWAQVSQAAILRDAEPGTLTQSVPVTPLAHSFHIGDLVRIVGATQPTQGWAGMPACVVEPSGPMGDGLVEIAPANGAIRPDGLGGLSFVWPISDLVRAVA
jgi:hypothetical protein